MNLPDSIQYKSHSVHSLFEPMHGYILSITFGNAIDFHSMGLVNRKKRISIALNLRLRLLFILIYRTPIIQFLFHKHFRYCAVAVLNDIDTFCGLGELATIYVVACYFYPIIINFNIFNSSYTYRYNTC